MQAKGCSLPAYDNCKTYDRYGMIALPLLMMSAIMTMNLAVGTVRIFVILTAVPAKIAVDFLLK